MSFLTTTIDVYRFKSSHFRCVKAITLLVQNTQTGLKKHTANTFMFQVFVKVMISSFYITNVFFFASVFINCSLWFRQSLLSYPTKTICVVLLDTQPPLLLLLRMICWIRFLIYNVNRLQPRLKLFQNPNPTVVVLSDSVSWTWVNLIQLTDREVWRKSPTIEKRKSNNRVKV